MLDILDGDGFGMDDARETLNEDQDQGKIHSLTEKYGFDVALGMAAGVAGPEVAAGAGAAYGAATAGEYAAEKAQNPDYTPVKDAAEDFYDEVRDGLGDFKDEYGHISLSSLDEGGQSAAVV